MRIHFSYEFGFIRKIGFSMLMKRVVIECARHIGMFYMMCHCFLAFEKKNSQTRKTSRKISVLVMQGKFLISFFMLINAEHNVFYLFLSFLILKCKKNPGISISFSSLTGIFCTIFENVEFF